MWVKESCNLQALRCVATILFLLIMVSNETSLVQSHTASWHLATERHILTPDCENPILRIGHNERIRQTVESCTVYTSWQS